MICDHEHCWETIPDDSPSLYCSAYCENTQEDEDRRQASEDYAAEQFLGRLEDRRLGL